MDPNVPRAHPQQALAVYVEPLAIGRRVVVIGDASVGLGTLIAELGARSVCVWDPDAERARREAERAPPGVKVRALMRDGASGAPRERGQYLDEMEDGGVFDLAIVADLELFDDAEDLLARVRRLVGDLGVALVAAPNREGTDDSGAFDYYELFELVAREFEDVTMIAQLPFYGVALAELGEQGYESPTVSVDTQLAGADRTPEAFIALASQRGARLDPYAIVELASQPEPAEVEGIRAALVQARLKAAAVDAQVAELSSRFAEAERETLTAQRLLEEALRDRSLRIAELETALAQGSRQLVQLSDEAETARQRMEAERVGTGQLQALVLRAERAELALKALEPELASSGEAHVLEVARYEEALRDRAKTVRLLEAELDRRERMVRELVDALEEAAHKDAPAPTQEEGELSERDALAKDNVALQQKLDTLALELARREGEAQASTWTVAELERRLEATTQTGQTGGEAASRSGQKLEAALEELDVLRRALAQEHEARVRAESSQKFAPASSEVQRHD